MLTLTAPTLASCLSVFPRPLLRADPDIDNDARWRLRNRLLSYLCARD